MIPWKEKNYLEDGLVDVDSATEYVLEQAKVSIERKRAFKGECKKIWQISSLSLKRIHHSDTLLFLIPRH